MEALLTAIRQREDGEVRQLQPIEGEGARVAGSLGEFFGLEGGSEQ